MHIYNAFNLRLWTKTGGKENCLAFKAENGLYKCFMTVISL